MPCNEKCFLPLLINHKQSSASLDIAQLQHFHNIVKILKNLTYVLSLSDPCALLRFMLCVLYTNQWCYNDK